MKAVDHRLCLSSQLVIKFSCTFEEKNLQQLGCGYK